MKFSYTALSKNGKTESGEIVAATALAAGHLLKEQGLAVTAIREAGEQYFKRVFAEFGGVKLPEKIVFIQDLSIMLKSGIPVARSLRILSKQTGNHKFAAILVDICQGVENGKGLYECMSKFPQVFSEIFVSMIKVGEMSGNLDQSLQYLRVQLEREADLRSRVRGAMIYPTVIIITMCIVGFVMSVFVLPKLTSVFKEFGAELPFATRVLISLSDFLEAHALLSMLGLLVFGSGLVVFLRTPGGKRLLYTALLYFPILHPLVTKINLARFARVFSSLLKSGIPIVESLEVAADSIPNVLFREAIKEGAEDRRWGE